MQCTGKINSKTQLPQSMLKLNDVQIHFMQLFSQWCWQRSIKPAKMKALLLILRASQYHFNTFPLPPTQFFVLDSWWENYKAIAMSFYWQAMAFFWKDFFFLKDSHRKYNQFWPCLAFRDQSLLLVIQPSSYLKATCN